MTRIYFMRVVKAFVLIFGLISSLNSQQLGIDFKQGNWEDITAMADSSGKIIFVDMYADWCVPCQVMEDEVFTYDEVGIRFNQNFISTRMDVEGLDGNMFSAIYGVKTLPGLLFITSDETLVYKSEGYKGITDLINMHNEVIQPGKVQRAWAERYKSGDRKSNFLYAYGQSIKDKDSILFDEVMNEYLLSHVDWSTTKNKAIVLDLARQYDDSTFQFVLNNYQLFHSAFKKSLLESKIESKVLLKADELESNQNFEEMEQLLKKIYGQKTANDLVMPKALDHYSKAENWKAFETYCIKRYNNILEDSTSAPELYKSIYHQYMETVPGSFVENDSFSTMIIEQIPFEYASTRYMEHAKLYKIKKEYARALQDAKMAYKLSKKDNKPMYSAYKSFYKSLKKEIKTLL